MQPTAPTVVTPGFTAPVGDAQIAFRAMLSAVSSPGQIVAIDCRHGGPASMAPALAAACLTLLDYDTKVWLDPALEPEARDWLAFHTGAPVVADPKQADFAVIVSAAEMPGPSAFGIGTDEAPETGTTLLVQVQGLRDGRGLAWSGPGIETRRSVSVDGPTPAFWAGRHALGSTAPRGVDVFFFLQDRVVALPRTTRVEV